MGPYPPAIDSLLTSGERDDNVHGLSYPPGFLDSLPTLNIHHSSPPSAASSSSSASAIDHSPIRRLIPRQFASIHLKYATTHAPDHVLFPFLHGLEGENEAQNQFFASAGTVCIPSQAENPETGTVPYVPQVPKYRGLVWVAADDPPASSSSPHAHSYVPNGAYDPESYAYMDAMYPDSEADDAYSTSSTSTTSDDDDFDDADVDGANMTTSGPDRHPYVGVGEVPMDLDLEMEMDVDVPMNGERHISALRSDEAEHMHPVKERSKVPSSASITVSPTPTSPTATVPSLSPSPISTNASITTSTHTSHAHVAPSSTAYPPIPLSPPPLPPTPQTFPILTSSFKSRDLVRESRKGLLDLAASPNLGGYGGMGAVERFGGGQQGNGSAMNGTATNGSEKTGDVGEWEFVEPKVPDGISLRNFGIQAPIYATISDIVIYSPQGNTSASIHLAQKLKQAVEKKYAHRLERLRSVNINLSSPSSACENEDAFELVKYNVFVLDASPEEIHTELEYLVSRVEDVSVAPHVYTNGTDGGAHGDESPPSVHDGDSEQKREASTPGYDLAERGVFGTRQQALLNGNGSSKKDGKGRLTRVKTKTLRANTINFAQREKDEMRDLTRASEILTFFPASTSPSPGAAPPKPHESRAPTADGDTDTDSIESQEKGKEEISGSSPATYWDPALGQVFLGNSNDVPTPADDPAYARRRMRARRGGNVSGQSPCTHSPTASEAGSSSSCPSCSACPSCADEEEDEADEEEWDWTGNGPEDGFGYDICIECDDLAPFPSVAQMKKSEEHVKALEKAWVERCLRLWERKGGSHGDSKDASAATEDGLYGEEEEMVEVLQLPPRPPPNPNAVIHLPFPSSVTYTTSLLPFLSWLEALVRPQGPVEVHIRPRSAQTTPHSQPPTQAQKGKGVGVGVSRRGSVATMGGGFGFMPSSLPPPSAFPSSFLPSTTGSSSGPSTSGSAYQRVRSTSATYLHSAGATASPESLASPSSLPSSSLRPQNQRNSTAPSSSSPGMGPHRPQYQESQQQHLTRPLKVLIYSADGYTESSSLALCLLMAFKGLSLPEAYLELQVEKRRSFFVYSGEVGPLRRVEARLEKERVGAGMNVGGGGRRIGHAQSVSFAVSPTAVSAAKMMSEMQPQTAHPLSTSVPKDTVLGSPSLGVNMNGEPRALRRRAKTMPLLPSLEDHQAWFNDPRFDGSFPSRVLPFLYLGNLNHATNAYMLHALGITHVVSVGECALVPPPHHYPPSNTNSSSPSPSTPYGYPSSSPSNNHGQFVPGQGPNGHGSLWIEEREGRIKVLDIKGVCDDGIDTLEPQLAPICAWIDRARLDDGKVLVHCRVGVSRSATVTIAYVMQYLGLPLVDAYLIVRSRRLSVLIQPNMRLLYNLLGWELKLARERCQGEQDGERGEARLREEMSRCLNWPFLAKEVHALNEKYLR